MHRYAPTNTQSQRGLNSIDYNIPAEAGIKINKFTTHYLTKCFELYMNTNIASFSLWPSTSFPKPKTLVLFIMLKLLRTSKPIVNEFGTCIVNEFDTFIVNEFGTCIVNEFDTFKLLVTI